MTPDETIEEIQAAKKALAAARNLPCTCTPSELSFCGECTCLHGLEEMYANAELWGIIAMI